MASTASLMGIGMAMQAAGQGIDKTFQYKMAELRQKSLEELEGRRMDIAERQIDATEARIKADSDYRKEQTNMQYQDRFYERGNEMINSVLGEAGMSDLERQLFLKLVEVNGDVSMAKEDMVKNGYLTTGTEVSWDKLKSLYSGLNRLHGQTIGKGLDVKLSIPDIQEYFPRLGGLPMMEPSAKYTDEQIGLMVPPLDALPNPSPTDIHRERSAATVGPGSSERITTGPQGSSHPLPPGYEQDPLDLIPRVGQQPKQGALTMDDIENAQRAGIMGVPGPLETDETGAFRPYGRGSWQR